jgi:hypothetical protein
MATNRSVRPIQNYTKVGGFNDQAQLSRARGTGSITNLVDSQEVVYSPSANGDTESYVAEVIGVSCIGEYCAP